tara:strand:- start:5 stop:364 length:360 start_codon:yes stop_codon:yes gene_type:complete
MNKMKYIILLLVSINLSSGNLFNADKIIDMRSADFESFLKNYEKRLSIIIQSGFNKDLISNEQNRLNLIIEHNKSKNNILSCYQGSKININLQKPCIKNSKNSNKIELLVNNTNLIKVN